MIMRNNFGQRQSARQGFAFQTRLASLLEMPEKEYAELIREIESDPLFVQLKYADDNAGRAIRSRRLRQTDLSRRFFELKEEIAGSSGDGGAEVEKLLAGKEKILEIIRNIGEEKFKQYFIFNEDALSLAETAECCAISAREAQDILLLINDVDIYSEFHVPSNNPPANSVPYHKIAILAKTGEGISLQFTSAHWARGLYDVDYEKIERLAASGRIAESEYKKIKKLLEKIELINVRKSLMHNIISRIMAKQQDYLQCHLENGLAPFMQIELARDMNVHPSIISRATAGRSVETPWGEEKPLKAFFVSAGAGQREAVKGYIAEILAREKMRIEAGEIRKPLSDKAIAAVLNDTYACALAQRTVAKYRTAMKIPGAFFRHQYARKTAQ